MPKIGVEGPFIARYNNINGVVSYTDGFMLARMTKFEASPDESGSDNDFYSNNDISETDRSGSKSGKISESVDNFTQKGSKEILGIVEENLTIDGKEYPYLVHDERAQPGYWGKGIIIKKRKDGKDFYRAVVYTKTMYNVPSDAATTQGKNLEWQTEDITSTYMPDDSANKKWKVECTVDTREEAVAFVETFLNFQRIGVLTLTSAKGSAVGKTKLTVSPALMPGNKYVYVIMPDVGKPSYDDIIEGYDSWNGTEEIIAATDMKILVIEIDSNNKAKKAGIALIKSNDGE